MLKMIAEMIATAKKEAFFVNASANRNCKKKIKRGGGYSLENYHRQAF